MPTRNIIPRKEDEGSLGISSRYWKSLYATTVNAQDVIANSLNVKSMLLNDTVIASLYSQEQVDDKLSELSDTLNARIDSIDTSVQDFSEFVTNTKLQSELTKYVTNDRFTETIANFVNNSVLSDYYDKESIDTTLASYVQINELVNYYDKDTIDNALSQYVLSSELLDYATLSTLENFYDKDEIDIMLNEYITLATLNNKLSPISNKITTIQNTLDKIDTEKFLTTDLLATNDDKSNKIVLTNEDGVLPVDISGSTSKIVNIQVDTTNIQDGDTLVYDSATNSFKVKNVVNDSTEEVVNEKINTHNDDLNAHADRFRSPLMKWTSGTTYVVNDIVVNDNKIWMCTEGNTDVEFDKNKWVNIGGGGGYFLGEIRWLSAEDAEAFEGILKADGAELSRTMYPDLNTLYAAQGYPWGDGDGSTTFNLPNLIGKFAEGADSAGGYHEAGLPNIEGNIKKVANSYTPNLTSDGAFTNVQGGAVGFAPGGSGAVYDIAFDASRSSSIYGKSDTVQPPSALLIPYVVVFTDATPDSALVDMTQVAQDLANKANRSLTNVDSNIDYVVDSYHDAEGNWYRVYKSGWVEQGGRFTVSANSTVTNTYLKPYTSNPTLLCRNEGYVAITYQVNTTSTAFTVVCGATAADVSWYACGMGANI